MLREFLRLESAGGIILMAAAVAALIIDNSPAAPLYDLLLTTPVSVSVGTFAIAKPLILWINDGLMAVFFFLVGLELKREMLEGELASRQQVVLPAMAAIGGMAGPALVYVLFNAGDETALRGWAVPAATDIAFALGILMLLGSRVPLALKVFLSALAILDDLGAIVIIAIFYTADMSWVSLAFAAVAIAALAALNIAGVRRVAPYILVGVFLWVCVLKSGVHATLAGVVMAFFIPLRPAQGSDHSPLRDLEHRLHPWVAFLILPVFGFANAGVNLSYFGAEQMLASIPLGVALGLFVGKQVGVFGMTWLAFRLGLARKPEGTTLLMFYGVALLTGVGFTMSLFIGGLAFDNAEYITMVKLGVLAGSLLSGLAGYGILRWALGRNLESATQGNG
ncbi:MAG: Na+/H+ antiporter NhaA [Proteobacteria bacterium]|nr:Na+/H+ antiporter NhaA [Pseudomonadota bacterium]MDA0952439.1 Na+/H+ antiporter NhaA [Pseudomonadota bacterium]